MQTSELFANLLTASVQREPLKAILIVLLSKCGESVTYFHWRTGLLSIEQCGRSWPLQTSWTGRGSLQKTGYHQAAQNDSSLCGKESWRDWLEPWHNNIQCNVCDVGGGIIITVVSRKSAHGPCTLLWAQTRGWADVCDIATLTTKKHPPMFTLPWPSTDIALQLTA